MVDWGAVLWPEFLPEFFLCIWQADLGNKLRRSRKQKNADPENNIRRTGKQHPPNRKTTSADHENKIRRTRKQKNAANGLSVFRVLRCSILALVDVRFWHLAVFVSANLTRVQIRRLYSNCIENSIARGVRFCYLVVFVFAIWMCSFSV